MIMRRVLWIVFGSGMCCSVRDSLIGTLEAVLSEKKGYFDYVLVETTGVANPEKVKLQE